jgi:hypothetical protein
MNRAGKKNPVVPLLEAGGVQMRVMKLMVLAMAAASLVMAMPIVGLYSTGAGSTPGNTELNWVLDGEGTPYVTQTTGFPIGNGVWTPNTATSQWISPQANYNTNPLGADPGGNYTYSLSFTLGPGLNPATAWFDYGIAADDEIVSVYLNGTEIGGGGGGWAGGAMSYYTTGVGNGFQSGLNEIVVTVWNSDVTAGNPAGLQFDFVDSDVQAYNAIPEPATFALVGLALAALPLIRRKRG